jgi:tRNA A-37 threonylcarbamoyl transferase component Bud32
MPNLNGSLQDQLLQSWKLKSKLKAAVTPEDYRQLQSDGMFKYIPNADFQLWMQRTTFVVFCVLISAILLWQLCVMVPAVQYVLFGFFKWILIPIKPLLIANPSAAVSGIIAFLARISILLNIVIASIAVWFATKAAEPPKWLYFYEGKLYILNIGVVDAFTMRAGGFDKVPTLRIGKIVYPVWKVINLTTETNVSLLRPQGKKSIKDYVLTFDTPHQAALKVRWGDIVSAEDRNSFFQQLEEQFPDLIEPAVLEPFRPMAERQSYTELWLRELSDAPKRDKLAPLTAGTTLDKGNYTILSKAGVGGQGTAYFADSIKHTDIGHKSVVLKEYVLPVYPDVRVRRKAAERFQAEAGMLKRLHHPQIAEFIDLFVEDHRAYVVMELVEGRTLKELVAAEGPSPESAVVDIATQILEILCYLHEQTPPVIHRDLTPDNVMLDADGRVKLIDFSVAQEASSGVTGSVVGKPNYISPEQFRGKPTIQSDLYSLGATMFFLLVGHDPSPISILHPKSENDRVSGELDEIIARSTQPELVKRFENAQKVLESLRRLSEKNQK